MARKFTPLYTSIWQEDDFTGLNPLSQALYFTLISQPNINSVGLLPMTFRRWRKLARWKVDDFDAALEELVAEKFVMVDEETEELLVRTFIKWDGGTNHPMRLKSILKDSKAVQSLSLRHFIGTELALLGVAGIATPKPPESDPEATEVPTVPVLTLGDQLGNLEPGTWNPELGEGNESQGDLSPFCSNHPNGTGGACRDCGTARVREERQKSQRQQRADERRQQLATATADCTQCDDKGWLIDNPDRPRRCTHGIAA
jgi:hypothetical protein